MDKDLIKVMRPLVKAEKDFVYTQHSSIGRMAGAIGYLRADFGSSGEEFWATWNDLNADWKHSSFKQELDAVINGLREKGELLSGRAAVSKACYGGDWFSLDDGRNSCGLRVDTEEYSYLMRLNPYKGEYNLYCYCYVKALLDLQLEQAAQGIAFQDWDGNEICRVPDGGKLELHYPDGKMESLRCRFINEDCAQVGFNNPVQICAFVEEMQKLGVKIAPAALVANVDKLISSSASRSSRSDSIKEGNDKTMD